MMMMMMHLFYLMRNDRNGLRRDSEEFPPAYTVVLVMPRLRFPQSQGSPRREQPLMLRPLDREENHSAPSVVKAGVPTATHWFEPRENKCSKKPL